MGLLRNSVSVVIYLFFAQMRCPVKSVLAIGQAYACGTFYSPPSRTENGLNFATKVISQQARNHNNDHNSPQKKRNSIIIPLPPHHALKRPLLFFVACSNGQESCSSSQMLETHHCASRPISMSQTHQ